MNTQILYHPQKQQQPEFAVIPWSEYQRLCKQAAEQITRPADESDNDYLDFDLAHYITNPIRRLRVKAGCTQSHIAKTLGVSQAYIAKIEHEDYQPTPELIERIKSALETRITDTKKPETRSGF